MSYAGTATKQDTALASSAGNSAYNSVMNSKPQPSNNSFIGPVKPVTEKKLATKITYTPFVPDPALVAKNNAVSNQSTTALSSDKSLDIAKNNNALNTLSTKGVTSDPKTGVSTDASGNVYDPDEGTTESVTADTSDEDKATDRLLKSMQRNLDASTNALISNIRQKYDQRRVEQADINRAQEKGVQNALLMGGATGQGSSSQYAPISSAGIVQAQESYGLKQISALDSEENDLIAQAKAAQQAGNFKIMEQKLAIAETKRQEKIQVATKLNEQIAEQNNALREKNIAIQTESAITDLYNNGVTDPTAIASQLRKSGFSTNLKTVKDTVDLISGVGGTGIIGEYNYYKAEAIRNGQVPVSFMEYQNIDANRKKSIAAAGVQYGGYDSAQQKAIDAINTSVTGNDSYKKYVAMQTYANNVSAGLSQGSGIGDIAAINQFQKVIDEGAVTRDQDVKLIQGAQSLANSLKTKINKLSSGQQLSLDQRQQMLELTQQMLSTQKQVLEKDPGVQAQKKKADRYKVDFNETVLGELGGLGTGGDLINTANKAKTAIDSVFDTLSPDIQNLILSSYESGLDDVTIYEQLKNRDLIE